MKKGLFKIIGIIFCIIFAYIIFLSVKDMNKPNKESDLDGKDISKEEYIYKDDLLDKGYSIEEVKTIQDKFSLSDVKSYLLNKAKFENLLSFTYNPYFKLSNLERYISYYKKNPSYSFDQVVLYVEIGLDQEFYTNVNEIDNYYETTAIVNKYNKIPNEIEYEDLVKIPKPYSNDGKKTIRNVVYNDLIKMIDDASKEKIELFVVSGYRTWDKQQYLFNNSSEKKGIDHALKYSAKTGHSEHQLGLAIDFNKSEPSFEQTKQYTWLKQNAYKYGFIERYPKNKEFITGFAFEPWHYRYLGVDIATKLFEENITYEEYLVKYKK